MDIRVKPLDFARVVFDSLSEDDAKLLYLIHIHALQRVFKAFKVVVLLQLLRQMIC